MSLIAKSIFTSLIVVILTFGFAGLLSAQSHPVSTGVVTNIETTDDGTMSGFSLVAGDGNVLRFTVSSADPNTAFGLENRVGDRWVSDLATDPREAATRLRDQQNRLTQISVQSDSNGVAISVVQAASKDVAANLGYLFSVVAIAWIGIMAYVAYLGVRQRTISAELARLRGENQTDES